MSGMCNALIGQNGSSTGSAGFEVTNEMLSNTVSAISRIAPTSRVKSGDAEASVVRSADIGGERVGWTLDAIQGGGDARRAATRNSGCDWHACGRVLSTYIVGNRSHNSFGMNATSCTGSNRGIPPNGLNRMIRRRVTRCRRRSAYAIGKVSAIQLQAIESNPIRARHSVLRGRRLVAGQNQSVVQWATNSVNCQFDELIDSGDQEGCRSTPRIVAALLQHDSQKNPRGRHMSIDLLHTTFGVLFTIIWLFVGQILVAGR